ncbi:MAG: energy transducer TonB [Gammaproteobacteria bacterium]|nr:energy transducer TonB [Gammaproteobacteria bacterium]MBT5204256.1 energy transducer TonB [Gammaproteobacteria bacterium]MBT5602531.1 energy transducer TonB [Gammaproteobacteria bacterium]MBT6246039.1 energy transducer TonB [Gammaproteobacteria bacterium]
MTSTNSTVTTTDRLSFTLFLAFTMHAVIIVGITFSALDPSPQQQTLDITLVRSKSDQAPTQADYIAQHQQLGSGSEQQSYKLKAAASASQSTDQSHQSTSVSKDPSRPNPPIVKSTSINLPKPLAATEITVPNLGSTAQMMLAGITTDQYQELDDITQLLARRPRITRVNSLSTLASPVAYYLNSWRRKVENIGNLNYPDEARRTHVYGNLRLLVALLPDGSLKEVILLESSGHSILDEAAIRIVHLAAPYAPFPDELRQTTDILEIIRTWQFRRNERLSFSNAG